MNTTILMVDDEEAVLKGYVRNFGQIFEVETAIGPKEALKKIALQDKYAVVISDYAMPEMNGIEFLQQVRDLCPDTVRILITGFAELQVALDAINEGWVFRFLTKPCQLPILHKALEAGVDQYYLINAERELLDKTLNGSIQMLGDILSVMDPQAFGRSHKLCQAAKEIALTMGIYNTWEIEIATTLAEIGRVTLPPQVLRKEAEGRDLTTSERDLIKQLPEFSSKLLLRIPRLESLAQIILYQNKNFDGTGFPQNDIKGENIPAGARILKVLTDILKQIDTGKSFDDALGSFSTGSPHQYDPKVLEALAAISPKVSRIFTQISSDDHKKFVTVEELKVGHILLSNIETSDGMLLINAGHMIRPAQLQRIRNFSSSVGIKEPIAVNEN